MGYKRSTSKDYDKSEGVKLIKSGVKSDDTPQVKTPQVNKPKPEEKLGSVTKMKENQNTTCGNGCVFNGERDHHGTSSVG